MKTAYILLSSLIIGTAVFAQKSEADPEEKTKKIETIKIIDGDTIVHDVCVVNGDNVNRRYRRVESFGNSELDEEMDEMIKNLDIYINVDDDKKKMIVNHLIIEDAEIEDILEHMKDNEDLVLDMKEGRENVKVIKIEIDKENGEEVKIVKMQRGIHQNENCRAPEGRRGRGNRNGRGPGGIQGQPGNPPQGLKVYPNPASDELNLEFGVPKGSETQVVITDFDGKQIFNKTYKEPGYQKESINLDGKKEGVYIVTLKDDNRNFTKKIIIE